MASINSGTRFIYGGRYSEEFGVSLATSFGSTSRSSTPESRTIVRSKNSNSRVSSFHGVKYESPLSFDIIVFNDDGTFIDTNKERELKKWLMSSTEQWLQIDQDDHYDIQYFCIASKAEVIDVGSYSGGMLITFECDQNGAWTNYKPKNYSTVNGTLSFKLSIVADYDDEVVKPSLIITPLSAGNISIKNNTLNNLVTINNCTTDEIITIDGISGKVGTTKSGVLLDRWNKKFLKLSNGYNDITLTGNFSVKLGYRLPVRVCG